MKWIVDDKEYEDSRLVAQFIVDNVDDSVYDDMLDECYEPINICGLSYSPSLALYKVDIVAYSCGKNDYYDSLFGDIVYELERMDDGETANWYGIEVECKEDTDEDN